MILDWFFSFNTESAVMNLLPGSFIYLERTCTSRMWGYYTSKSISVSLINDRVWYNIVKRDEYLNQSNNDINQSTINNKIFTEYFTNYTGKYQLPKDEKIFISPAEHVCLYVEPKTANKFLTKNERNKQLVDGFYVNFGKESQRDVAFVMENNTFIKIIIQNGQLFDAVSFMRNGEEEIVYECKITSQDIADFLMYQDEIIILPIKTNNQISDQTNDQIIDQTNDKINFVLPVPTKTAGILCKTIKPIRTAVEKTFVRDEECMKDINEYNSALREIEMPNKHLLILIETEDISDKNKKVMFYTKKEKEFTNKNDFIETAKDDAHNLTNNEETTIFVDKSKCGDEKEIENKQKDEDVGTDKSLISKTQTSHTGLSKVDTKSNAKDSSEDIPEEKSSMFWIYLSILCTVGGILIVILLALCYKMYASRKKKQKKRRHDNNVRIESNQLVNK